MREREREVESMEERERKGKRECKEESDEIMNNKDNQQKRAHTHQISIILNFSALQKTC